MAISGRTNVNIWKDTGSNDQKWSINSLGTSQQVRTLNNTTYMLNAYRTNWNCDVYTSNSDTYVNFMSQGNNFRCTGSTFSGTLSYSLFDHFGLDDNDVKKIYGWTQQFCAWYVLQHYKNCKGAYKPFISYMDFDVSFSGSL